MAGGAFVATDGGRHYEGKVTAFVLVTCFVAAMGGLLFGYDLGITGGVTSMEPFLIKFFPSVYKQMKDESGHDSQYCKFDNQLLTLFTSSLYLAALVASFFASITTRLLGRKPSMFIGGLFFLGGALLNGFAVNIEMLIIGRLLLGLGVGYCNQVIKLIVVLELILNCKNVFLWLMICCMCKPCSLFRYIYLKWLQQKLEEHLIWGSK